MSGMNLKEMFPAPARSGSGVSNASPGGSGTEPPDFIGDRAMLDAVGRAPQRAAAKDGGGRKAEETPAAREKPAPAAEETPEEEAPKKKRRSPGQAAAEREEGARFPQSDKERAKALADRYGAYLRWVEELQRWIVWDETEHGWVDDGQSTRRARAYAFRTGETLMKQARATKDQEWLWRNMKSAMVMESTGGTTAALNAMKSLSGIAVPLTSFDADPMVLAAGRTAVTLGKEISTRGLEQKDYCRHNTGIEYVPGATHRVWTEFLDTFLPEPAIRAWFRRQGSYSLRGGNPARRFMILLGASTSGKGFVMSAMGKALGKYAGPFGLQMFRAKQDSDLNMQLIKSMYRRIIFNTETSSAWQVHADELKRLTGGEDRLSARAPHASDMVEAEPSFTPWQATNAMFNVAGMDGAVKNRMLVTPFTNALTRSEEKVEYQSYLNDRKFLEAVLAWFIEGFPEVETMGYNAALETPPEALALREHVMGDINPSASWITDHLSIGGPDDYIGVSEAYSLYKDWCEESGLGRDALSSPGFGKYLTNNGYGRTEDPKTSKPYMKKIGKPYPERIRRGVRFRR
jgi:P4 family phage/plasmid primase-like protien